MLFFSKLILATSFATAAFGLSLPGPHTHKKRTLSALLADLAKGGNQLAAINKDILAFSPTSGTDEQAQLIQLDAVQLTSTFAQAEKDIPAGTASENDAKLILSIIEAAQPPITTALTNLVARKARFAALGDSQIVLYTVEDLANAVKALEAGLVKYSPEDLTARANAIANTINNEFAEALKALA